MNISHNRAAFRITEFCEKLGVCASTFWNWKRAGLIKTVRVGGVVLIPASEIERLMQSE